MSIRRLLLLAVILAAVCAAGCGGGSGASGATTAPQTDGAYLAAQDLQRDLGNGFRTGLTRLAVMQQHGDDATDLGQPLTPGLLDHVRCSAADARPASSAPWAWDCTVSWQTAAGAPQRTRYSVRLQPGGCFSAGASPQRRNRYDPTIRAYSEDPLNAVVSSDPQCS